jgi:cobalt-zinc-cadmium efflux system membrane fusion protein
MDAKGNDSTARGRRIRDALASGLPSALVLLSVAAVGLWGHHTGWRAPRFSELLGEKSGTEEEDWCAEHNVPESGCISCRPELAGDDPDDWCKEHGVPESKCTVCHPEILETGVPGDWCEEHGVPESGCTICRPDIARGGAPVASETSAVVTEGTHAEELPEDHPNGAPPRSVGPLRNPKTCQKHALKVQFASAAAIEKVGVKLGNVVERTMSDSIVVNGEVDYDRTRFAKVSSRVPGTAWRVETPLGAPVHTGEVLALIDSPEVGRAKTDYLQAATSLEVARKTFVRVRSSAEAGFRTEAERLEAEAAVRLAEGRLFHARNALMSLGLPPYEGEATEERLTFLGLPDQLTTSLKQGTAPASLVPIFAPFDGTVVAREIVKGEVVDPERVLFEVADTSRMWVTMDVPQADAHRIALGQTVIYRPDDARDESVTGEVAWVSTAVDEMTRTVKVLANVPNPRGALRAHSFGRAQIVVRTSRNAVALLSEAIQWEGCCYVVFVRLTDTIFQTRKVRLGARDSAFTEILVGVLPGEVVPTTGSHVLKSEILKSSLGAGCTDV